MKTTIAKPGSVQRRWQVVDASNQVLGRLAVTIAERLRGKHTPLYSPNVDTGDFVVVINAGKVRLTGRKEEQKTYVNYSGYRGGLKTYNAAEIRARHPERLILDAVKGMLPKNRLMRQTFKRLKVYAGAAHPHGGQVAQVQE